jgi:hypothetical protein
VDDQIEVSGVVSVPICVKVHGSSPPPRGERLIN